MLNVQDLSSYVYGVTYFYFKLKHNKLIHPGALILLVGSRGRARLKVPPSLVSLPVIGISNNNAEEWAMSIGR